MSERISSFGQNFDKFLRSEDTPLGQVINMVSPKKGEEYLKSVDKRALDILAGTPAAIAAAPLIVVLGAIKNSEDGEGALHVQGRLKSKNEIFPVFKIRTMVDGAHKMDSIGLSEGKLAHHDPRVTKFGAFLRRAHLDELPQIFQAILGQMSLVGNRPILPQYAEHLSKVWSSERYSNWIEDYGKGRKGITGIYQVFGPEKRNDQSRYRMDMLYTKKASLGLDLYLLWRTIGRVLRFK